METGTLQVNISQGNNCNGSTYSETFADPFNAGVFDVMLGEGVNLPLNYDNEYYICSVVNGEQVTIDNFNAGVGEIFTDKIDVADFQNEFLAYGNNLALGLYNITSNFFIGDGSLLTGITSFTFGDYFDQVLNTTSNVSFHDIDMRGEQFTYEDINGNIFSGFSPVYQKYKVRYNLSTGTDFDLARYNGYDYNMTYTSTGSTQFPSATMYKGSLKINGSNHATMQPQVKGIDFDFDYGYSKSPNNINLINFKSFFPTLDLSEGLFKTTVTTNTSSTVVSFKSTALNYGSGLTLGYRGWAQSGLGATGTLIGVEGYAVPASTAYASIAMQGNPRPVGQISYDKQMAFRAVNGHIFSYGIGDLIITNGSAIYRPLDVSTNDFIDFNDSKGGSAYIQSELEVDGLLFAEVPHAEIWIYNHTGYNITFAIEDTYYPINFMEQTNMNGFTLTDMQNLTAVYNGMYDLNYCANGQGENNHIYETKVYVNDIGINRTSAYAKAEGSSSFMNMCGGGYLNLITGSKVTLRIEDQTGVSQGDLHNVDLRLSRIGH